MNEIVQPYTTVEDLVRHFRSDEYCELEMNLGMLTTKTNCLTKEKFTILHNIFINSAAQGLYEAKQEVKEPDIFIDCFYNDNVRCRCTMGEPVVIRKFPIAKLIASCAQRNHAFYFNLKREVPHPTFDTTTVPIYMRIQTSWTYVYKDTFMYVLKKVQGGQTKEIACAQPTRYELELELMHNKAFFDAKTDAEIAFSFSEKCLDLAGRYNAQNIQEKLFLTFAQTGSEKNNSEPNKQTHQAIAEEKRGQKKAVKNNKLQEEVSNVVKKEPRNMKKNKTNQHLESGCSEEEEEEENNNVPRKPQKKTLKKNPV